MQCTLALTLCLVASPLAVARAQVTAPQAGAPASTRITDPKQHGYAEAGRYPFRAQSDYILEQLDLQPGDTVVDIGAGDGWWSERMVKFVGDQGVVHAAEVSERLVDRMQGRFADDPRIKPYLCPTDGTGLPENSCDLAFIAQTYHHLDADGRVRYLRHLKKVLRPTGRFCVVEKHSGISTRSPDHGTHPDELLAVAAKAGWVLVRYELMPRTYHYLAIFAQKEMFSAEPPRPRRGRRGGDGVPEAQPSAAEKK